MLHERVSGGQSQREACRAMGKKNSLVSAVVAGKDSTLNGECKHKADESGLEHDGNEGD